MKKINTFLFDLDGTLVNSVADIATGVNLLRQKFGLRFLSHEEIASKVGDGVGQLVKRSLPEGVFSEEHVEMFLRFYDEHLCEKTYIYPGILDFLKLHSSHQMAVVTNKPTDPSCRLLEKLAIRDYFAAVLGPDCCATKKPDPGPVLEALRILDARPESAVMIGDHHTDLRAGRGAGVNTCFCAWGIGEDGGVSYDFLAETPADLLKLFPA